MALTSDITRNMLPKICFSLLSLKEYFEIPVLKVNLVFFTALSNLMSNITLKSVCLFLGAKGSYCVIMLNYFRFLKIF